MSKNTALEERVKTLEKEVERLEKVNEALMRRVERSTDAAGAQKKLKKHPDELGEAEQELKLYKRVFMASGDAILIHDHPEGKIIAKNPAYQRIVGTSEEEKGREAEALPAYFHDHERRRRYRGSGGEEAD
jgi:PAS domain-containing protein